MAEIMGGSGVFMVFAGLLLVLRIPAVSNDGSSSINKSSSPELTVQDVYRELTRVSAEWERLGFLLKVPQHRLNAIKRDYRFVDDCYRIMLHAWYDADVHPSWDIVTWALDQMGQNGIAESIRKKYTLESELQKYPPGTQEDSNIPGNHEEQMEEMERKYVRLAYEVMTSMKKMNVNLEEVKFWLTQIPVSLIYTHKNFLEGRHIRVISRAESLLEIFGHLRSYWNFLDYGLLEYVAVTFGNDEVKQSMRRYKEELTSFRKSVTLSEFMRLWPNRMDPTPEFSKLVIKLNRMQSFLTLQNVEEIRLSFARNYSFVTLALMYGAFENGSAVLTWFIPSSIAPQLVQDLKNGGSGFLKEHNITEVSIDGHTVAITDLNGMIWNLRPSISTPVHFWSTTYAYFLQPGKDIVLSCSKTCAKASPPIWYHTLSKDPWLPMSQIAAGPELELSLHQPPVTTDVGYFCCACIGDHPKVGNICFGVTYMPHIAHFSITRKGKAVSGVHIGDHIKIKCGVFGLPSHVDIAGNSEIAKLPQYTEVSLTWYSKMQYIEIPQANINHSGIYTCAALLHASPDLCLMTEHVRRSLVVYAPPTGLRRLTENEMFNYPIMMPVVISIFIVILIVTDRRKRYKIHPMPEQYKTRYSIPVEALETNESYTSTMIKEPLQTNALPMKRFSTRTTPMTKEAAKHLSSDHISCSSLKPIFSMPAITIDGVSYPIGIAVNNRGEIAVTEGNCISIFTRNGEKRLTFSPVLHRLHGVAFDSAGNILVTDVWSHSIKKFTPEGKFLAAVGRKGRKILEFHSPTGISFSHKNKKVYVCDRWNNRVQVLNEDFTFSSSFGRKGSGDRKFDYPCSVAFDSNGDIYVADSWKCCIQVFTPEERFLRKFGKKGSGEGELNYPSSVYVDSNDTVYVTERDNHRVSIFTSQGRFIQSFGAKGTRVGEFNQPHGIAVDTSGLVYVSDTNNNRVQGFKKDPSLQTTTILTTMYSSMSEEVNVEHQPFHIGIGTSQPSSVSALAVLTKNQSYKERTGTWMEHQYMEHQCMEHPYIKKPYVGYVPKPFEQLRQDSHKADMPERLTTAKEAIQATDYSHPRKHYRPQSRRVLGWEHYRPPPIEAALQTTELPRTNEVPKHLSSVSLSCHKSHHSPTCICENSNPGPVLTIGGVSYPSGIAVNRRGEIAVAEHSYISIFTSSGEKMNYFRISSELGQLSSRHPCGVTFDCAGNILVTDVLSHCIKKFTPEGKYLTAVGRKGSEELEFSYPAGIGIHHTSTKLYICDRYNHRVHILNKDLTFSSSFGSRGRGEGLFSFPWSVAFDSTGNVYIADCVNHHIQVFMPEGRFVRKFGKKGSSEGELSLPSSVCIDSNDVVYVTERGNHRVSIFTSQGEFLRSFGTKGDEPGKFNDPWGVTVDESGIVYVSDTNNNRVQIFKNLISS